MATVPAPAPAAASAPPMPQAPTFRRRRWTHYRIVFVVVSLLTATAVGWVGINAVQLTRTTEEVQQTQLRASGIAVVNREVLLLTQEVLGVPEDGNTAAVSAQRGIVGHQLARTAAYFPPGAAPAEELDDIAVSVRTFPWEDAALPGRRDRIVDAAEQLERRVHAVRRELEEDFVDATLASVVASRQSQVGQAGLAVLAGLLVVVVVVGYVGRNRRSRDDISEAYSALQNEYDERKAAEKALRASERRFRSLVQHASDLTVVTDETGVITYVSPVVQSLIGHRPEALHRTALVSLVDEADRDLVTAEIARLYKRPGLLRSIELRLLTSSGGVRTFEALCRNLTGDPDVGGLVWNGRDMTDRRALEDELLFQARHDPLTGLPNRTLLLERLRDAVRRQAGFVAVLLVDLDGFKNVNDTLGHPAGDELLRAAAGRILGCVREGDTAARLGGDEFAVIVATDSPRQAVAVGERLVDALSRPFSVAGQEVRISASIGLVDRAGGDTAENLLRDADIAMYVAKRTGKSRLEVFEPDMRQRASQRTEIEQELVKAVELGRIEVYYQPVVDLRTRRPEMLEALARWRRDDGTLEPAGVFIPVAEETGAIVEIGRAVLRAACHSVRHWRTARGQEHLRISVNVSVHQVLSGNLYEHVVSALREVELPPSVLTLEITESTALEDSARVTAEFAALRELGVQIAVDDFGAGYSSLGRLMHLEADTLKIDRSLLEFDTTRRGSMVAAIAELGRTLELSVVVEGVETPDHLLRAQEAGCDAVQGYHFAKPMPPQQVAWFLQQWDEDEVCPPRPAVVSGPRAVELTGPIPSAGSAVG